MKLRTWQLGTPSQVGEPPGGTVVARVVLPPLPKSLPGMGNPCSHPFPLGLDVTVQADRSTHRLRGAGLGVAAAVPGVAQPDMESGKKFRKRNLFSKVESQGRGRTHSQDRRGVEQGTHLLPQMDQKHICRGSCCGSVG